LQKSQAKNKIFKKKFWKGAQFLPVAYTYFGCGGVHPSTPAPYNFDRPKLIILARYLDTMQQMWQLIKKLLQDYKSKCIIN